MNHSEQVTQAVTRYLAEIFEESHALYLAEVDDPENWTRCATHETIAEWENRDGLTTGLVWENVEQTMTMDYAEVEAIVRPILRELWVIDQMKALNELRESFSRSTDNA